jgi:ubiquinone/menaquinone biosynthesis C-methylase UbiE
MRGLNMTYIPIEDLDLLVDLEGEADLYSLVSDKFKKINAEFWDKANNRLMEHLHLERPARMLDLACGAGGFIIELARRHPRLQITGVDLHPEMVRQGRQDAAAAKLSNIQFIEQDLFHHLPKFMEGEFDMGVCMFALSYLGVDHVLTELRRILGPSGQAGVTTCSFNSLPNWQHLLLEFFVEHQSELDLSKIPKAPNQPVNAPDLKGRMEAAGFQNVFAEAIQIPLSFPTVQLAACFLISSTWVSNQFYSIQDKKLRRRILDWNFRKIPALYPAGAPITTSIEFLVGWNQPAK